MLTAEEVRAIVRDENLRLLRVLLEVQSHGNGHVSANVAVVALTLHALSLPLIVAFT